jgi:hypothetical protein
MEMALSEQDAILLKRAQVGGQAGPAAAPAVSAAVKIWRTINVATPAAAVSFLNSPPPQGAGEAFATEATNGSINVFYFL